MVDNVNAIISIEMLAACQGIDFHKPTKTSPSLQQAYTAVRDQAAFYESDRPFHQEIADVQNSVIASDQLESVLAIERIFD